MILTNSCAFPNIGLDIDSRTAVVEILNHTLASETILAIRTRRTFWNSEDGIVFSEQHRLYKTQSQMLDEISERISERVSVLGGVPVGSLAEIRQQTRIKEAPQDASGILALLADHELAIRFLREDIHKCVELYEDEGTRRFLVSILSEQEKIAWMLRAVIEPES